MAGAPGIEPGLRGLEALVLPLHHTPAGLAVFVELARPFSALVVHHRLNGIGFEA